MKRRQKEVSFGQKPANRLSLVLFTIAMLLLMAGSVGSQSSPQMQISVAKDKEEVDLNDEINMVINTRINGILVLSIPTRLWIVEPDGNEVEVSLQSNYDGNYRGSFKPIKKGVHQIRAVVTMDDQEEEKTDSFVVREPGVKVEIHTPDSFYYSSGPVEITGSVNISDRGTPLDKSVEIMVTSSSSPFFKPLCEIDCSGSCDFACDLAQNIELTDYEILARISHNSNYFSSRTGFSILFSRSSELEMNVSYRQHSYMNETQAFSIKAEYDDKPLRDALVNVRIADPDGRVYNLFADEILRGQYLLNFKGKTDGEYKVNVFLVKDEIYGSHVGGFNMSVEPYTFVMHEYEVVPDNLGGMYVLGQISLSKEHNDNFIDISPIIEKHILNISDMYIIINKSRHKVHITDNKVFVPSGLMDEVTETNVIFEASVIDEHAEKFNISTIRYQNKVKIGLDSYPNSKNLSIQSSSYIKRVVFKIPEDMEIKCIINDDLDIQENWYMDHDNLVVYADSDLYLYFRDNSGDMNGEPAFFLRDIKFNKGVIIQGDLVVMTPIIKPAVPAKFDLVMYYPNRTAIAKKESNSSFRIFISENMPSGRYFIELFARDYRNFTDVEISYLDLRSSKPDIDILGNYSATATRNSEIEFKHTIVNNNYAQNDAVGIIVRSNFSSFQLIDPSSGKKLYDTDRDDIIDMGEILPGEEKSFILRVQIPASAGIGISDFITITAVSSLDPAVKKTATDIVKVAPIASMTENSVKRDLAVVSIDDINENVIVKIKNYGKHDAQALLNLTIVSGPDNWSVEQPIVVKAEKISSIVIPKEKYYSVSSAKARLLDIDGNDFSDQNMHNNERTLHESSVWYNSKFSYRIPIRFSENLGVHHKSFIISCYLKLIPDVDISSLKPVYFNGKRDVPGSISVESYENGSRSGNFLVEFPNVDANIDSTAFIYFSVNSSFGFSRKEILDVLVLNNKDGLELGRWVSDNQIKRFLGVDYIHDLNMEKGFKSVIFKPKLMADSYEIYVYHPSSDSFSSKVPVIIESMDGVEFVELNQKINGGTWNYIGAYNLNKSSLVRFENFGTDSLVVVDGIKFKRISYYSSAEETQFLKGAKVLLLDGTLVSDQKDHFRRYDFLISENSSLVLNLSDYLEHLSYISYNHSENISIDFSDEIVVISPDPGFTGKQKVIFDDKISSINVSIEIIPESEEDSLDSEINGSYTNFSQNMTNTTFDNQTDLGLVNNLSINRSINQSDNLTFYQNLSSDGISNITKEDISENKTNATLPSGINQAGFSKYSINLSKVNESVPVDLIHILNISNVSPQSGYDKDSFEIVQLDAKIGEPVRWKVRIDSRISSRNEFLSVVVPKEAREIIIRDMEGKNVNAPVVTKGKILSLEELSIPEKAESLQEEIMALKEKKREATNIQKLVLAKEEAKIYNEIKEIKNKSQKVILNSEKSLLLSNDSDNYEIEYTTKAPQKQESEARKKGFEYRKDVIIKSNASIHYQNIVSFTDIPESTRPQVKIYWKAGNRKLDIMNDPRFDVKLLDTNENDKYDRLEWITPKLSEQQFEIVVDLTIMNVQSYPTLFGNWTVVLNTTGKSNLTISPSNDTSWTEFLVDAGSTEDDLKFLDFYCGNLSLSNQMIAVTSEGKYIPLNSIANDQSLNVISLVIADFECDELSHLENNVVTTGSHHIEFRFGNDLEYAHNYAFLLYEDFDSYPNTSNATDWVDYSTLATVLDDSFLTFDNSTHQMYSGDTAGTGQRWSVYNSSTAYLWEDYRILFKAKVEQNYTLNNWGFGIYFYYRNSSYYNGIVYEEGGGASGYEVIASEPLGQPDNIPVSDWQTSRIPAIGVWQNFDIRINRSGTNTTIRAKIWNDSESEPSDYNIIADDTNNINQNGTIVLYVQDAEVLFDDIMVEDMSSDPVITIDSPESIVYSIGENIWFNISVSKRAKNCSYTISSNTTNMTKVNDTHLYSNRSYSTYGLRTVTYHCEDYFGNTANASVSFQVGSGAITIVSPTNATLSDYTPLLDATFNNSYDAWYNVDNGSNSSQYPSTENITLELSTLNQSQHFVYVYINNSGVIDYSVVFFGIDVPVPSPVLKINEGDPDYTSDEIVDLYIYGDYIHSYRLSCNDSAWSGWINATSSPDIYEDFNLTNSSLGCNSSLGIKKVYLEARNYFNETSSSVVDNITYQLGFNPGGYFRDDFRNISHVNDSNEIQFNATASYGVKLNASCHNYSFEAGCWQYKRQVDVTITGPELADYAFDFNFDSRDMVSNSKIQGDCEDIRITWFNESSGAEQQVYFWNEEGYCNSSKTRVWILAPYLNSSSTNIFYFYYGNPSASISSYNNGTETFDFFDGFNVGDLDMTRWDDIAGNGWGFPVGEGYVEYWNAGGDRPSFVSSNDFANGTLYWRMQTTDSDGDFDGAVGVREPDTDNTAEGYFFMLDSRDAANCGIVEDNFGTTHAQYSSFVPQDLWVRAKATFSGSSLTFYNDYHQSTLTASDTSRTTGGIEMWCDSDNGGSDRAALDWIIYLNRTADYHSASLGSEEVTLHSVGNITSDVIRPAGISSWEYLTVSHTIPEDTNISYSIYDQNDNLVCDFETGEAITQYDISGCAFGHDRLKVYAELETENTTQTPILSYWMISWIVETDVLLDEPDEIYQERFIDFFMNGSVYSPENSCNITTTAQYKLRGQAGAFIEDDYSDFSTYTIQYNMSITDELTLEPNTSTDSWYDQAWPYRKKFNVSLTEAKTDYPVKVVFSSSDLDFGATDSFGNIRMIHVNKTTGIENVIPHWVQSENSTDAVIWIRAPGFEVNTDEMFFIYYGNPSASNTSNGDNVFDFFDTFNGSSLDGTKWINNEGDFTISGGEFVGDNNDEWEYVFSNEYSISAGTIIEFSLRSTADNCGDWDSGIGVGTWNFVDDDGCGNCLTIDRNRWWNDETNSGQARWSDEGSYHIYRVWVDSSWSAFFDDTQGRINNVTGSTFGPLYLVSDGDGGGDAAIFDWIFAREEGPNGSITMLEQENSSFMLTGNYTSDSFDTGASTVFWGDIEFDSSEPSSTSLKIYTRSSHDDSYWTDWTEQTDGSSITSEGRRYIQYLVVMNSSLTNSTPELSSVIMNYVTASPTFSDMSSTDTTFSTTTNPYLCGIMNRGEYCYPEWNAVTPKVRGKFQFRLRAEGQGSCSFLNYSNEKIIYVFAETQITGFDSSADPAARSDTITLSGNLFDDLSVAIPDKTIKFYEGSTYLGSATTGSSGQFSFQYTIPISETTGLHTYTARFHKDYEFYYLGSKATTTVTISSNPVVGNISINPDPAGNAQKIEINATATDEVGMDYTNITITLPNGTLFRDQMVDMGDGNYSYNFSDTWDIGTYLVTITGVNTDGISTVATDTFEVRIESSTHVMAQKDEYISNEDVLIEGRFSNAVVQDFTFRQPFNLYTAENQTNFTLILELNSTNFEDWELTDGSDLKFLQVNGSNEDVLFHWVKEWDDSAETATIYVKLMRLQNATTVNMYYGNGQVSDFGNESDVYLWYDNGSADKSAQYSIVELQNRGGGAGYTWDTANRLIEVDNSNDDICAFPTGLSGPKLHLEITTEGEDDDGMGLFIRSGATYYETFITSNYPTATDGIYSQTVGNSPSLIQSSFDDIDVQSGNHTIVAIYNGSNLSMYVDGVFEANAILSLTPDAFGFVTLAMGDNGDYLYNFKARKIAPDIDVSFGEKESATGFFNLFSTPIKGYRWGVVQRWTGTTWQDINPAVVNDWAFGNLKTISGSFLDIQSSWNSGAWNTGNEPPGWYRVKIAFVKNTSSPQLASSIVTDNNANSMVAYYNFTIRESRLAMTNLTHENLYEDSINEYETTDDIDWINITVKAINNTGFNSNVTLTLLDEFGLDYVGFGPNNEMKNFGTIVFNTTETETWDNSSNEYYIPKDIVSGTYLMTWNVSMVISNGISTLNDSEFLTVHNMPDYFVTNNLERLYIDEDVAFNLTMTNLWSKNLTNVTIALNCPNITGLNCSCNLSGQSGSICNLYNLTAGLNETGMFNIIANQTVEAGDYNVNFTINYTNPSGMNKSWTQVKNAILEVRSRGILEIFDLAYNSSVRRGEFAYFKIYANNTNGSVDAYNASLNYTAVPYNWTNISGGLEANHTSLPSGQVLWNNVTFSIGYQAGLGVQTVTLNTSSDNIKSDFKDIFVTVWANTSFNQYYLNDTNVSRGEVVRLTAVLWWDNGSALSGETVYFYDETDGTLIGSGVTNAAGTAVVNYNIDSSVSLGKHTLNVTYRKNAARFTRKSNSTTVLDVGLKPTIKDIYDSPDPVGYGYNVTIWANVTDDDALGDVKVIVRYPNMTNLTLNMTHIGSGNYSANFTDTWQNGTFYYYLWANDSTGSFNTTSTKSFLLAINATVNVKLNKTSYNQYENVTLKPAFDRTWWNESWGKRRILNITTTESMSDYNLELNLTSTNFDFSSGTDGSDLRFIWEDGSTYTLINHWCESWNSSSQTAKIWLKIPTFENNTIIHMYYNASDVEDLSNINDTYLWADNFSSDISSQYTEAQLRDRTAGGGFTWNTAVPRLDDAGNNDDWAVFPTGVSAPKLYVEARGASGDNDATGVMIRSGTTYYEAIVTDDVYDGGTDGINNQTSGNDANLMQSTTNGYSTGTVTTKGLAYNGSHLKMWVNDNYEAEQAVSITPNAFGIVHLANDPFGYSYDLIARTYTDEPVNIAVSGEQTDGSAIFEHSTSSFRGQLIMEIQKDNAGTWENLDTHINDSDTSRFRVVPYGSFLNLSEIWNPSPWSTSTNDAGTYRLLAYMVTPYGGVLQSKNGPLEGYMNFTILPPSVNVTIDTIRIYNVTSATRYAGGNLVDSGTNKTFNLFVNRSYRIEIDATNQPGSTDWDLSLVNVSHYGLNSSWGILQTTDIWYKVELGSVVKNGSFQSRNLTWNTSITGGTVSADKKATFYYAVNISPDNTTGDYPVKFKLVDPTFQKQDDSLFHVIEEVQDAPELYNDIYNMSLLEVIRTYNTTMIYARWNNEIDEADVYYNATIPGIISDSISLPSPNTENWTNHTFNPNQNWLLGRHVSQIQAKNPSGVWNDSLQYLNFSIFGLAYVDNLTLNASYMGIGKTVLINCSIEDDTNDTAIPGYNITIYSNEVLINWNLTNDDGYILYNYTPATHGIYGIECNISEQGWYKTDNRYKNTTSLFIKEYDPPKYYNVSGPALAHKTDNVTFITNWTDNAALAYAILATNASASMTNVSDYPLSGLAQWANITYVLPSTMTPGIMGWRQYGNDTSDNYNQTPLMNIEVWGWASISDIQLSPTSVGEGNYTNATCRVVDSNDTTNGIQGYNVSFYRGGIFIGWNITNATGWARHEFNESAGVYRITCNITDSSELYYNASSEFEKNKTLIVVEGRDLYPPVASIYDINQTSLMRYECLDIYAYWNEQINYSKTQYNITNPIIESVIPEPYIGNWTNYTICTNNSWNPGEHAINLWVNDSVGNINDSVPYKWFNLSGRSEVQWVGPNGSFGRGMTDFICRVEDNDTNTGIEGYRVLFYGPKGFISSTNTNSTGHAKVSHDTSTYGSGNKLFECNIIDDTFYDAVVLSDSQTIELLAVLNVTIDNPVNGSRLYRGQEYFLNSTVIDDNNTGVDPDNATWFLSNNTVIGNDTDVNYTISPYHLVGYENITLNVSKASNTNDSTMHRIEIWSWAKLNASSISQSTIAVDQEVEVRCQVIDFNNSEPLSGVNVTFFSNNHSWPPGLGSNLTDSSGWASLSFSYNDSMTENITCQILDQQFYNVTNVTNLSQTLVITDTGINLTWIYLPSSIIRGDTNLNMTLNVTNIVTSNLSNVNVTLDLPYNWSFIPGNSSKINLWNLSLGESKTAVWYFDVGLDAASGNQYINSSAISTEGYSGTQNATINVLIYDLGVIDINAPSNDSCYTTNFLPIQARIENYGSDIANAQILFKINETVENITYISIVSGANKTVNYSWKSSGEGQWTINVTVNLTDDENWANNSRIHSVTKYYPNMTMFLNIEVEGEDQYNSTLFVRNNVDCAIDNISWYYLVPKQFNMSSFSLHPTDNKSVESTYFRGTSLLWKKNFSSNEWLNLSFDMIANQSISYPSDMMMFGLDP